MNNNLTEQFDTTVKRFAVVHPKTFECTYFHFLGLAFSAARILALTHKRPVGVWAETDDGIRSVVTALETVHN